MKNRAILCLLITLGASALIWAESSDSEAPPHLTNTQIRFTELRCIKTFDEFTAEPYLWPVFFRIDGLTAEIFVSKEDLKARFVLIEGKTSMVWVEPGVPGGVTAEKYGHGNIGGGMSNGDERDLDITVNGYTPFSSRPRDLSPIAVFTDLGGERRLDDAPAIMGCVAVVMEEDETSNAAVLEGYKALVTSVHEGIDDILKTWELSLFAYSEAVDRGETPQVIPEEDIEALKTSIEDDVEDAIREYVVDHMSTWDKFWEWLGGYFGFATDHDGIIGSGFWYWTTNDLKEPPSIKSFNKRWRWRKNIVGDYLNDWQLLGEVQAEQCYLTTAVYGPSAPELDTFRRWRDESLSQSVIGRWLVNAYYRIGPRLAQVASNSPSSQRFFKALLRPLVREISRRHPEW